jgi:alcohol dehydrogenase
MSFVFEVPNKVIFGCGASDQIVEWTERLNGRSIMVVCDPGVKAAGIADPLLEKLTNAFGTVSIFHEVTPDPDIALVERMAEFARAKKTDLLIVIGGGSAIDATKAVRVLLSEGGAITDYEGMDKITKAAIPMIAIPTTSGTGSEVTSFSIVSDHARKRKMVLAGRAIAADVALVDPLLTMTMPKSVTASTGMDAMTHAIEAALSTIATPLTDLNAYKAISLIYHYLPKAVHSPEDIEARSQVMLGSLFAGIAFNSAILGLAHAIAHPLGVVCGLPHGLANAIVLPEVVAFNGQVVPEKVIAIGHAIGLTGEHLSVDEVVDALTHLNRDIGIPSLSQAGIAAEKFDEIAELTLQEVSLFTNPAPVTFEDIKAVLAAVS